VCVCVCVLHCVALCNRTCSCAEVTLRLRCLYAEIAAMHCSGANGGARYLTHNAHA